LRESRALNRSRAQSWEDGMARLPALTFEELTEEQKKLWQEIGAVRSGSPGGPFAVWMHYPKIAERAHLFGNAVRLERQLGRRLLELAVLIVARHWNAEYVFAAHVPAGREHGLSEELVEAIRIHRTPNFANDGERLVYDTVRELLATKRLSEETYARAHTALGTDRLIELVTAVGFYMTAAAMVNAFDVGPRHEGKRLA
jgi:4-carboxymuconolactone decarboxylase